MTRSQQKRPPTLRATFLFKLILLLVALAPGPALAEGRLRLQSTTSIHNSGLYAAILPAFTLATQIEVQVIAVGTGQALRNAANCDGDVVIVHARAQEDAFVAAGYGTERFDLMSNDFVLIGPRVDPARIRGRPIGDALKRIQMAQAPFISRGDNSGTHTREKAIWAEAGLGVNSAEDWFRSVGAGMGATLNIASALDAYTLTDRATWATFANKADLTILVEGDESLLNPYGLIPVNPRHCPHVDPNHTDAFVDWILGPEGQAAIRAFRPTGDQLFFPATR